MTDLTEQWKKGELPEGRYWVKIKTWCEYITMLYYTSDIFLDGDVPVDNEKIIEVLAPVPSYDEFLSLTYAKEEDEKIIAEYEQENTKLKELLGECLAHLTIGKYGTSVTPINILCDEVEEALK